MIRSITLLVFSFCTFFSFSQNRDVDSLQRLLPSQQGAERVVVLEKLGNAVRGKDAELGRRYFNEGLALAIQLKDRKNEALLYYDISRLFRQKNYDSVIFYAKKALVIDSALANHTAVALECYSIGLQYQFQGKPDLATTYYVQGLEAAEKANDKKLVADGNNNMAFIHKAQKNFQTSKEFFEKGLALRIQLRDTPQIANSYNNLGLLEMAQDKNAEAREWYLKAISTYTEDESREFAAMIYNNIGITLENEERNEEALTYFLKSVAIKEKVGDQRGLASTYGNIAAAMKNLKRADQTILYAQKSYDMAEQLKHMDYMLTALHHLSDAYAMKGDYKNAYREHVKWKTLGDSVFSESKSAQILDVTTRYETEKKEKENQLLKKEVDVQRLQSDNQQWIIFTVTAGLIFVIALAVIFYFFSLKRKQTNEALAHQNRVIAKKNDELTELVKEKNSLMNIVAHDLKSPLSKVHGLAELMRLEGQLNHQQQDYLNVMRSVTVQGTRLISDLLTVNKIEENGTHFTVERVSTGDFLEEMKKEFAQSAQEKNIRLHFTNAGRDVVLNTDRDALHRIFDNLVSNAIKFSPFGKSVFVAVAASGDSVKISVRDEGPGITAKDREKLFRKFERLSAQPTNGEPSTGLGLAIVKQLVTQLRGKIEVISEPGAGAEFVVSLPS